MKSFALLTLLISVAVTTSNDLRLRARPLCTEIETGACRCENNNEIDEYNSPDMQAKCFLGKDLEGNKIKFNFYPWLEKFHKCPVAGDIPAAELQKIWAEGEECWADQNPCDELDSDGISGGMEKCAEMKEKSEMDEEVNGEEEEPVVQVPKDPKLERSGPPLKKALSTGKGSDIFADPTPFDKALSTEKSILDALYADSNPASLGSAEVSDVIEYMVCGVVDLWYCDCCRRLLSVFSSDFLQRRLFNSTVHTVHTSPQSTSTTKNRSHHKI